MAGQSQPAWNEVVGPQERCANTNACKPHWTEAKKSGPKFL